MLWGFVMTSGISAIVLRKFSTPKKAAVFYGTTFLSMFYAKVAFSERVIDVFFPFLKFDIERTFKDQDQTKSLTDELMHLGKSKPVNQRTLPREKQIHEMRLKELQDNTKLLAPRMDDVDGSESEERSRQKVIERYEKVHGTKNSQQSKSDKP